jgi:hypothetical protein
MMKIYEKPTLVKAGELAKSTAILARRISLIRPM